MGLLSLLSWLRDQFSVTEDEGPDEEYVAGLVSDADSDTVTRDVLTAAGGETYRPLADYLEGDEQPVFAISAGEVRIEDADGSLGRKHPTRESVVLFTTERILIVVGGRIGDQVLEVGYEDVVSMEADLRGHTRYLVVDANREGDPLTFFVDVRLEPDLDAVGEAVDYGRTRAREAAA